jgi:hypothetical protein
MDSISIKLYLTSNVTLDIYSRNMLQHIFTSSILFDDSARNVENPTFIDLYHELTYLEEYELEPTHLRKWNKSACCFHGLDLLMRMPLK